MNSKKPSTSELLELASLDALGLLDEQERKDFEAGFEAASEEVRAQLRREQQRLTGLDEYLPEVEPPVSLRARVIAAVRAAFASPAVSERDVIAHIAPGAWSMRGNVTPLWRAACIGFATATVVLLTVGYNVQTQYKQAMDAFRNGELTKEITKSLGPKFVNVLLDEKSQHIKFAAQVDREKAGQAVVLINPETKTGLLVCKGLEALDGEYRLVIVDNAGAARQVLAHFETKGELMSTPLQGVQLDPGMKMSILAPLATGESGSAVLTSSTGAPAKADLVG